MISGARTHREEPETTIPQVVVPPGKDVQTIETIPITEVEIAILAIIQTTETMIATIVEIIVDVETIIVEVEEVVETATATPLPN